jgi:hypothetical protein
MDPEASTTKDAGESEGESPTLGPPGEKALEAFKTRARDAERALKEERAARDELVEEVRRLREESQSDVEKAIAKASREAAEAARKEEAERAALRIGELMSKRLRDRIALAATGRFMDPDVVARLLDPDELVADDGEPDEGAIGKALDSLVERAPYLAIPGQAPKPPPADPDSGPRGGNAPGDLDRRARDRAKRMGARDVE